MLATALALLLQATPTPGVQAAPAMPCPEPAACRDIDAVVLTSPQGKPLRFPFNAKAVPYAARGNLMITPGEAVVVTLQPSSGAAELQPRFLRAGAAADAAPLAAGELRFRFAQAADKALLLQVESRWAEPLNYAALKNNPARGPGFTSVCTLLPGRTNIERWEEPIIMLSLSRFAPTTMDKLSCPQAGPSALTPSTPAAPPAPGARPL